MSLNSELTNEVFRELNILFEVAFTTPIKFKEFRALRWCGIINSREELKGISHILGDVYFCLEEGNCYLSNGIDWGKAILSLN